MVIFFAESHHILSSYGLKLIEVYFLVDEGFQQKNAGRDCQFLNYTWLRFWYEESGNIL